MSDNTKIEWSQATWNPVTGCTKVSPGCDHCYAERITNRFGGPGTDATYRNPERPGEPRGLAHALSCPLIGVASSPQGDASASPATPPAGEAPTRRPGEATGSDPLAGPATNHAKRGDQ